MSIDDPLLGSASYLLLKAGRYVIAEFDDALDELTLSHREALVLSFVSATEGLSQQELSDRLGLDPTIVVGLVDGLESRGLLKRLRDPDDRRRNKLLLTEHGVALRQRAIAAISAFENPLLGPLSDSERRQLQEILHKMMAPRLPWLR